MRKLGWFVGMLVVVATFFSVSAWAQFSPGKEAAAGGDTTLEIKQVVPGKATLHFTNIYAVFLNGVPNDVRAHLVEADHSGKGTAYVVNVASNPALSNLLLGLRGTGSDWNTQASAPIVNGSADVTIDVGAARKQVFALVPVLIKDQRARDVVAWGSHPRNTRRLFNCPGLKDPDMLSVFTVDANGIIRIATDAEADRYQKHYVKFCGIGR